MGSDMVESAVVLVIVILVVLTTDGRDERPRLLWPVTNAALLVVAAAVSFWAFAPWAGDAVRAPITIGTMLGVALMILNLVIERHRQGWSS